MCRQVENWSSNKRQPSLLTNRHRIYIIARGKILITHVHIIRLGQSTGYPSNDWSQDFSRSLPPSVVQNWKGLNKIQTMVTRTQGSAIKDLLINCNIKWNTISFTIMVILPLQHTVYRENFAPFNFRPQTWGRIQNWANWMVHKGLSIYLDITTQSVASPRTPHSSMMPIVNRVHPLTMVNMSDKLDEEAHNGLVSIMFTSLLPHMSIVTLTSDLQNQ